MSRGPLRPPHDCTEQHLDAAAQIVVDVGEAVGAHQAVARPVGYRVAAGEVAPAIERLLRVYLAERGLGENFRQFCAGHSDEEIRRILAGDPVAAVERDLPQARTPHGLEG